MTHSHRQRDLHARLNHHIQRVQQNAHEIWRGGAVQTVPGSLQAIKYYVVDRKQHRSKYDHFPVEIDQQKRQHDEDAKVQLNHSAPQLNMQRDERNQHEGQHIAAALRSTGYRIAYASEHQEHQSDAHRPTGINKLLTQDHAAQGAEPNSDPENLVAQGRK